MKAKEIVNNYRSKSRFNSKSIRNANWINLLINAKSQCYDSVYLNYYKHPDNTMFFHDLLSQKLYKNDWSYRTFLLSRYGRFCHMPMHEYYYKIGNPKKLPF